MDSAPFINTGNSFSVQNTVINPVYSNTNSTASIPNVSYIGTLTIPYNVHAISNNAHSSLFLEYTPTKNNL